MDKSLIEFLEEDFSKIIEKFPESPFLWSPNSLSLAISFDFFEALINRTCFEIPFHPNISVGEDFNNRGRAFEEEFFENYEIDRKTFVISHYGLALYTNTNRLYLLLLYRIVYEYLLEESTVNEIYSKLKQQWVEYLENDEINITFIIPMPNVKLYHDVELIKSKLNLKSKLNSWILEKHENKFINSWKSFFIYKTTIPAKFYHSNEEYNRRSAQFNQIFENDWEKKKREIQEIIFTFYLNNIAFYYGFFIELLPWWIQFDFTDFMRLFNESTGPTLRLTSDDCVQIFQIYPDLVESELFSNDEYIIIWHHYMQLHNLDFTPDVIFNIFVLFEYLFGDNSDQNISFKIAFFSSMFLTSDKKSFISMFKFMKKSYGVRSSLTHGDEWRHRIDRIIETYPEIRNHLDLLKKWRLILNSTLKKIISRKLINTDILNDINELNDEKNQVKKANYLVWLGSYYEMKNQYSEALKVYLESLDLFYNNDKLEKSNQIENLIKKILKKKGLIIYREELNLVSKELELITKFNEDKKEKARKLNERLKIFFSIKQKDDERSRLPINGVDIMKIFGVPESPLIGRIFKIILLKIEKGVIKEKPLTREYLLKYLVENKDIILELAENETKFRNR